MTYSIIQKLQLERTLRLDAEFYQSEYLKLDINLSKFNPILLDSISEKITQGPNPKFQADGMICLNGRNIKNFRLEEGNSNYVSSREFNFFHKFRVMTGDILITLKGRGSIGKIGYVQRDIDAIFSRDIGLIRGADRDMSAFVFVFLMSKYGLQQIEKSITGSSGQLTLGVSSIKNFKIPVIQNYSEVSSLVFKSEKLFDESNIYYSEAEALLLKELNVVNFDEKNDLFSVVDLTDAKKFNRIDAEYFQSKHLRLKEILKDKSQSLLELVQNVSTKFEPAKEQNKEFKYVELANINSSNGLIDGYETVLGKDAPSRAKRILKAGDLIVSSVEGSLNKVALVLKEQEGYIASTGFFQFRSSKIAPEVLLIIMKSMVMQWQLKQNCIGTILTAVSAESLKQIYIPILPQQTQLKIADLVRKSHEARKKSKELLEEAKIKVEEMIENPIEYVKP